MSGPKFYYCFQCKEFYVKSEGMCQPHLGVVGYARSMVTISTLMDHISYSSSELTKQDVILTSLTVIWVVPWLHICFAENNEQKVADKVNASRNEKHISPLHRVSFIKHDESNE